MYYAGVGSRETPLHICELMTQIAKKLSSLGWVCRSGGAEGADLAFMRGLQDLRTTLHGWVQEVADTLASSQTSKETSSI